MSSGGEYRRQIRQAMASLTAASLRNAEIGLHQRLGVVTAAAVKMIRGADLADVMLIEDGRFESVAPTAPLIAELDSVQMRHQQGPCLTAAVAGGVIRIPDLRDESRWPEFTSAALDNGIRSALTFQLFTHDHGTGALNVFGRAAGSFNLDDEAIGAMLATHAAIVLIGADRGAVDVQSTLAEGDLIGQAKGILMERMVVDADTAFDMMMARARDTDASIKSVARDLIATI